MRNLIAVLSILVAFFGIAHAEAPYVGATEADREFDRITAADMKVIAAKKAIITSRSFGQNMLDGIDRCSAKNPMYKVPYVRNLANLHMGDPVTKVPADLFSKYSLIHYLCTIEPLDKRIDELAYYLRTEPWSFGTQAEVCMVEYHGSRPDFFATYQKKMEALAKEFPKITFIYVTSGLMPRADYPANEASWEFGELVLKNCRGKVPLIDWRSLLSTRADGTSAGHMMVPEFNELPAGNPDKTHPNGAFPEERLGRAWLVMMWKLFCAPK